MSNMNTLCLCMIVRNEARIIKRCIASVKHIIDYWVIIDTGSADKTKTIIRTCLRRIPGEIHDRPWVSFGFNRTQLVDLAKSKADYLLLFDADFEAVISDTFHKSLTADAYYIRFIKQQYDYAQLLLVSNYLQWKYVGVTHEYITCDAFQAGTCTTKELDGIGILHHADISGRADKLERDITLLKTALRQEPHNSRYVFYLAQSYKDCCDYAKALKYYRKRVRMGGWMDEVWYSKYQIGRMLIQLHKPYATIRKSLLGAFDFCNERAEPLYELARYCRENRMFKEGYEYGRWGLTVAYPTNHILFVHRNVYQYALLDEVSICAYYIGNYKESLDIFDLLLNKNNIPPRDMERIRRNREYAKVKLKGILHNDGKTKNISINEISKCQKISDEEIRHSLESII